MKIFFNQHINPSSHTMIPLFVSFKKYFVGLIHICFFMLFSGLIQRDANEQSECSDTPTGMLMLSLKAAESFYVLPLNARLIELSLNRDTCHITQWDGQSDNTVDPAQQHKNCFTILLDSVYCDGLWIMDYATCGVLYPIRWDILMYHSQCSHKAGSRGSDFLMWLFP